MSDIDPRVAYQMLCRLRDDPAYTLLRALWEKQGRDIVDSLKSAGRRGQESAWRFHAGRMDGFEIAITHLERAISELTTKIENESAKINVDDMIENLRGESV